MKLFEWFNRFLEKLDDVRRVVIWLFTAVLCLSLTWTILHYTFIYAMLFSLDDNYFFVGADAGLAGLSRWFIYSLCVVTTSGFMDARPSAALTHYISAAEVLSGLLVLSVFFSQFSLSLDPAFTEFKSNSLERLKEWIRLLSRWQDLKRLRLKNARF